MIALFRTAGLAAILAAAPTTVLAQRLGAGGTGIDNNTALPHCATPLGTIALVEKKADDPMDKLSEGLPALAAMAAQQNGNSVNRVDPIPLVRLMASTSGCFRVAERGEAYEALKRERQMAGIPETVRMVAADYVLNVQLLYSDANSRGGGGGLGGSFGSAIGLKTKALESQILLTMLDVKTGLQTAIATGSARKKDLTVCAARLAPCSFRLRATRHRPHAGPRRPPRAFALGHRIQAGRAIGIFGARARPCRCHVGLGPRRMRGGLSVARYQDRLSRRTLPDRRALPCRPCRSLSWRWTCPLEGRGWRGFSRAHRPTADRCCPPTRRRLFRLKPDDRTPRRRLSHGRGL